MPSLPRLDTCEHIGAYHWVVDVCTDRNVTQNGDDVECKGIAHGVCVIVHTYVIICCFDATKKADRCISLG